MTNDETRMTKGGLAERLSPQFRRLPSLRRSWCSLCLGGSPAVAFLRGRGSARGLSLIEILIALFVFLIGVLGVLSLFPVAMSTAGKSIGETRATVLARSALDQLKFDCTMPYFSGTADPNANPTKNVEVLSTVAPPAAPAAPNGWGTWQDYYVTITSGPAKGQSRRIRTVVGRTITVDRSWTSVGVASPTETWTAPGDLIARGTQSFVITRMGLPDAPFPNAISSFGLNRHFAVRSFAGPDGICAGLPVSVDGNGVPLAKDYYDASGAFLFRDVDNTRDDPFCSGGNVVLPMCGDSGTATSGLAMSLTDTSKTWIAVNGVAGFPYYFRQYQNYTVQTLTSTDPVSDPLQGRRVTTGTVSLTGAAQNTNTLSVSRPWAPTPGGKAYRVGYPSSYLWSRQVDAGSGAAVSGNLTTVTDTSKNWAAGALTYSSTNPYVYYMVILSGEGSGQARAIVAQNSTTGVTVSPEFSVPPGASFSYAITTSRGFVLITSGKATGRIYPIAADYWAGATHDIAIPGVHDSVHEGKTTSVTNNYTFTDSSKNGLWTSNAFASWLVRLRTGLGAGQVRAVSSNSTSGQITVVQPWSVAPAVGDSYEVSPGHYIICAGGGFQRHGVVAAERATADAFQTALQDSTTFTVLGGGTDAPTRTVFGSPLVVLPRAGLQAPPTISRFNFVPAAGASSPQDRLAPDEFGSGASYTSEYGYVAVLSETSDNAFDAVRTDIFVYRNFNPIKELSDNPKPVGYITGYIERP